MHDIPRDHHLLHQRHYHKALFVHPCRSNIFASLPKDKVGIIQDGISLDTCASHIPIIHHMFPRTGIHELNNPLPHNVIDENGCHRNNAWWVSWLCMVGKDLDGMDCIRVWVIHNAISLPSVTYRTQGCGQLRLFLHSWPQLWGVK